MSRITTHILDTSLGKPATGVKVELSRSVAGQLQLLATGVTDQDGRIMNWLEGTQLTAGRYHICFETGLYFTSTGRSCFYPEVSILFEVSDAQSQYHVPLLLSPYGYSTYRGS